MNVGFGMSTLQNKALDSFISIHMHKAGGTTFGHILMEMYRNDLFWDHSEDTVNFHGKVRHYDLNEVAKHKVIHGHIHVNKYRILERPYITWLRHPVSRLESEYSVIRQKRLTKRSPEFHRRILIEELNFETYCKLHREVYSRYLGNMLVTDFAFVGIVEHFKKSLHVFSKLIDRKIPRYYKRNVRKLDRQDFKESTEEEKQFCIKMNNRDIDFYEQAEQKLLGEFHKYETDFDEDYYEPLPKKPGKRYYHHG